MRTRLSAGEKPNRKRMAALVTVYDAEPAQRRPHDVIGPPGGRHGTRELRPGPKARARWLAGSVRSDPADMITAMFGQAEARDPGRQRTWVVLVDGAEHQLSLIQAEAARRSVTIHLIIDIIHVLEYICPWRCGKPGLVKYSSGEHAAAYLRIEQEGLTTWSELHGTGSFENFPNRRFLEIILPRLALPGAAVVLEYGCGTGPAACFLASLGYRVHGIDFVPKAIELARRMAEQRGLSVDFEVRDVCELAGEAAAGRYDLVLDSFCLQSVVTGSDRQRLFTAVRDRLKASGYYVISTAMHDPARRYGRDELYDAASGVCCTRLPGCEGGSADGDVLMDGVWYRPHRRHLTPEALRDELSRAGFSVLWQGGELGGDLVCARGDVPPPALVPG